MNCNKDYFIQTNAELTILRVNELHFPSWKTYGKQVTSLCAWIEMFSELAVHSDEWGFLNLSSHGMQTERFFIQTLISWKGMMRLEEPYQEKHTRKKYVTESRPLMSFHWLFAEINLSVL